jgi:hypothetical protein
MSIETFDDLLAMARQQPEPQRLLIVFAGASLPAGATAAQRQAFERGEAGELTPLMCVDKDPHDLTGFDALAAEAAGMPAAWAIVFAGALAGHDGSPPSDSRIDAALQRLVEAVRGGDFGGLIPFDRRGRAVTLG